MIKQILTIVALTMACAALDAQQPKPLPANAANEAVDASGERTPILGEVSKLQILNAQKDVETWQARLQLADNELGRAQQALDRLLASLTPKGYVIQRMPNGDLQLAKAPEPPAEQKKP